MMNIEQLAIEHGAQYVQGSGDFCFMRHELEAFAKALQQSSEPVEQTQLWESLGRWSVYLSSNGSEANLAPPDYLIDAMNSFTIPPSSVPLEKYNKLLDALKYYADKKNWSRDSQELGMEVRYYNVMYGDMYEQNDVTKYGGMRANQAIAEAEGKEG